MYDVLQGSVRPSADRLRITAQLVDASTGAHMWAEHSGPKDGRYFLNSRPNHRGRYQCDRADLADAGRRRVIGKANGSQRVGTLSSRPLVNSSGSPHPIIDRRWRHSLRQWTLYAALALNYLVGGWLFAARVTNTMPPSPKLPGRSRRAGMYVACDQTSYTAIGHLLPRLPSSDGWTKRVRGR